MLRLVRDDDDGPPAAPAAYPTSLVARDAAGRVILEITLAPGESRGTVSGMTAPVASSGGSHGRAPGSSLRIDASTPTVAALGEKIWNLQPLLPPEFTGNRGRRSLGKWPLGLDKGGHLAESVGARTEERMNLTPTQPRPLTPARASVLANLVHSMDRGAGLHWSRITREIPG